MMRKILFFGFLCLKVLFLNAQAPGCPGVTITAPGGVTSQMSIPCDSCVTLNSGVFMTGETSSYTVSSIPYAPPWPFDVGTPIFVGSDDVWSPVLNLPFKFCFYGNIYDKLVVGANGLVSFNLAYASQHCPWSYTASIPSPSLPLNSIFGPYHDIDPGVGGIIRWGILGSYPCRTFVVNFHNVPMYSSACNSMLATHQIVLYESTNVIEIHMQNKPTCSGWNGGRAALGIQNATGNIGMAAPGRNTGQWTTTNESWRFTPAGPTNFIVSWYKGNSTVPFASNQNSVTVCPDSATTYRAHAIYYMCDFTQPPVSVNDYFTIDNGTIDVVSNIIDPTICPSDSILLSVTATGNSPISLQWSPPLGLAYTDQTSTNASPPSSTIYTVVATSALNCKDSVQIPVTVLPAPLVSITPSQNPVCFEQDFTLTASGGETYLWNTNQTSEQINLSLSNSAQFSVIATDSNSCVDSTTIDILVYPELVLTLTAGALDICEGEEVLILAGGADSYVWNTNDSTNQITVNPPITTNYSVVGTLDSICTASADVTINVHPIPIVDFNGLPWKGCSPVNVNFNPQIIGDPIANYIWSFGSAGALGTAFNSNPQRSFGVPGTYDVQLIATTIHGCSDTLLKPDFVEVYENPVAAFVFDPNEVEIFEQAMQFTDLSTGADTWFWNFNDGNTSTEQNPLHFFNKYGRIKVFLTVTTDNGCEDTHWEWVQVIHNLTFYMPNAFLPGTDGDNKYLGPVGNGVVALDLKIFDRWGSVVFQSKDMNKKWDGKIGGALPGMSSTYHWKASVTFIDGLTQEYYGHVTLIR